MSLWRIKAKVLAELLVGFTDFDHHNKVLEKTGIDISTKWFQRAKKLEHHTVQDKNLRAVAETYKVSINDLIDSSLNIDCPAASSIPELPPENPATHTNSLDAEAEKEEHQPRTEPSRPHPAKERPKPFSHRSVAVVPQSCLGLREWVIVAVLYKSSMALVAGRFGWSSYRLSLAIANPSLLEDAPEVVSALPLLAREVGGFDESHCSDADIMALPAEELIGISSHNPRFEAACRVVTKYLQVHEEQRKRIVQTVHDAFACAQANINDAAAQRTHTQNVLAHLYTMNGILQSPIEMNQFAAWDFGTDRWWNIILKPQNASGTPAFLSHLHYCNHRLANELKRLLRTRLDYFFRHDRSKPASKRHLRILEGGVGGANTTYALIHRLDQLWAETKSRNLDLRGDGALPIQYRGYEINPLFSVHANEILSGAGCRTEDERAAFFASRTPRLEAWDCVAGTQWDESALSPHPPLTPTLVVGKNLATGFSELVDAGAPTGTVHIIVLGFVFHHVPNGRAFGNYIFRGAYEISEMPRRHIADNIDVFISETYRYQKNDSHSPHPALNNHFSRVAYVLSQYVDTLEGELRNNLEAALQRGYDPRYMPAIGPHLFRDQQKSVLRHAYDLLAPGGILAISDPDGFSSFNEAKVLKIQDLEMSVAHFLSRRNLVRQLNDLRFNVLGSMDLGELNEPAGGNSYDTLDRLHNPDASPSKHCDFKDSNLGYLIISEKRIPR